MPNDFRSALHAELAQAFSTPYLVPSTVISNAIVMTIAWFLLPRGWSFTITSPLAFPMVLASWMYADVPSTNVLAPDRVRVLEALDDPKMLNRLLAAKAAVLWLFVAPFCSLFAIAVGVDHHDLVILVTALVAICVIPVGCLPVAALIGIRWPYHALQIRYRWEHRQPVGRMIVRWGVLTLVPYVVVPVLAVLMMVPALVVLVRAHESNSHVVNFINAFGKDIGIHVAVGGRPMSTSMFVLCVVITCGVAMLTWRLGRMANLRLIRKRRAQLTEWLADPTMG